MDKLGHAGLNNLLTAYSDKSAYAQCIFAFSTGPDAEPVTFVGQCPGVIVPASGDNNFGYNHLSVFIFTDVDGCIRINHEF